MNLASSIRRNSFFSFLSSLIRLLTNVLLFVGIARFYGPDVFGQFTTAHTLSTIFLLFADFGLDVMLTTEVARQRHKALELFRRFLSLKLVVVLIAVVGMWVIPLVQSVSNSTRLLIGIFSFYVAFTALTNFNFALFKAYEQLQFETKVSFINNLILLIGLLILGFIGVPIHIVTIAFVGVRAIGLFNSFRIVSRLLPELSSRLDFSGWKEIRSHVFIFGFHLLFGNLYFLLDTILIAFWMGDHAVGIYQSAVRLITIFLVIPDVIINALMPVLSRFHEENKARWEELGKLMNKTLFFIALPVALFLFVYADQIIYLVYGTKAFADAIPLLRCFGIIVLIRFCVETYALMLTTSRRQKTRMTVVVLATIFNYLLNLYAIPHYGLLGAAVVSLSTNLFVGVGYIIGSRKFFIRWTFNIQNIIPVAVAIGFSIILWNMREISFWYLSPLAAAGCILASYFFGYTEEERKLVFIRKFW